jgi:DNA-binding transcriptional LysR family regulator
MTVFVRVAQLGSFSAAARDLALSTSGVSRVIGRLERRLGASLLHRTTRRVTLTSEGITYFEHSSRILAQIQEAEASLLREREHPRGLLRMHCGLGFGEEMFLPVLPEFLARYPELRVELSLSDRMVDLVEEGADLAVRIGGEPRGSMVARRICDLHRVVCASPRYLRARGVPNAPADLANHNCIYISGTPSLRRWPFRTREGSVVIEPNGTFVANSAKAVLEMAMKGVGIARLADAVVAKPLREGKLVRVLDDVTDPEVVALVALYPQSRRRLPKVAAMIGFLKEKFGDAPWRAETRARR